MRVSNPFPGAEFFLPRSFAGDSCLGRLSVGVENVVVCPVNCSVANASVQWCLSPPGECLESMNGKVVEYENSFSVNSSGELIVRELPTNSIVNTTCTYLLGNESICGPVSFNMTQKIGKSAK